MALDSSHPFDALTPELILDALEDQGYLTDGRLLALNSYENRVYQVGMEQGEPLVAKFYRPGRWSDEQILEEHRFSFELEAQELPIVTPLRNNRGESLFRFHDFRFALFPRRGGRMTELDDLDNLHMLGKLLGRMHRIGAVKPFSHRPQLDIKSFGYESADFISEQFIPADLKPAYDSLTRDMLGAMEDIMSSTGSARHLRLHGDCHAGNILWRDGKPQFVDLDDARMAPAIQDIWMLLSGERPEQLAQLNELLDGYLQFHDFDFKELRLIEVYRSLRILHFSAWLARRWEDPAFPQYFPWFNTQRYWSEHILELRGQFAALSEPPLQYSGLC